MLSARSICLAAAAGFASLTVSLSLATAAPLGDAQAPIRIALNEWTGQNITAHVAGQLLEKLGYKVQYVTAGSFPQWIGMQDGSIDMTPELWTNNLGEIYPKMLEAKQVEPVGDLGLNARDGWAYTDATLAICPACRTGRRCWNLPARRRWPRPKPCRTAASSIIPLIGGRLLQMKSRTSTCR